MKSEIKGTKLVEIPYLDQEMSEPNKKVLIVGERIGNEGIVETIYAKTKNITCTDIMDIKSPSILEDIIKECPTVTFQKNDFLFFDESVQFDYIVCINVLEHFGMNFNKKPMFSGPEVLEDDVIRWNYDMKALTKMIKLLAPTGKIIITVPCGPPVMSGDTNPESSTPFLRRYDLLRITKVKELVSKLNCKVVETFFYSQNFENWLTADIEISDPVHFSIHNPFSPNVIWAFTVTKQ